VFIQDTGQHILAPANEQQSDEFFYQQLSIAIQQGNAACVLGTLPKSTCPEERFYLQLNLTMDSYVIVFTFLSFY
jgi:hypothetical protein